MYNPHDDQRRVIAHEGNGHDYLSVLRARRRLKGFKRSLPRMEIIQGRHRMALSFVLFLTQFVAWGCSMCLNRQSLQVSQG